MRKGLLNFEDFTDSELTDLKLYRYFQVDDFIKTFEQNSLFLKKPHCWNDPFENIFLKSEIVDTNENPIEMGMMKERVFAQCWSLKEESDLMWGSYFVGNNGVKVEVSLNKIKQEIFKNSEIIFIGKIKYLTIQEIADYFSQIFKLSLDDIAQPIFESLLVKRKEFSEEFEVRILFFDLFRNNKYERIFILNSNLEDYKNDFTSIKISSNIFEKVVFHPKMDYEQIEINKNKLTNLGYKGIMEKSKLYDIPEFKIKLDHQGKLKPALNT